MVTSQYKNKAVLEGMTLGCLISALIMALSIKIFWNVARVSK